MRTACYYLIGFLVIYGAWTIMSAWLNCMPVARFWDDTIDGYCLDKKSLWFSNSAIHIFTDILIMLYPMPVLKNLQLPKRQKIALMGVFALGILYVRFLMLICTRVECMLTFRAKVFLLPVSSA